MFLLKVAPVLILVFLVRAEKKIELQDIEDDNLKNENQKDSEDGPEARSHTDETESESLPLEFFKNGFLRYYEAPQQSQNQRYVQQYAVSETPERLSVPPEQQYGPPPSAQQAMVGYLSNVPMQIYFVPQYYSEPSGHLSAQHGAQYQSIARVAGYQPAQEPIQSQVNYGEVPSYVTPTAKTYIQQYNQPVAYVDYQQPTIAPIQASVAPVLTYQVPAQYPSAIVASQPSNAYYQSPQYTDTQPVEDVEDNKIENEKYYSTHTEASHVKPQEIPTYYNSRTPLRDQYRTAPNELPHPSPLLLKPPPHLTHLAKSLPMYRPLAKPVYGTANVIPAPPRLIEPYGPKRRPNSLLDSYIPSAVQVEYLKRGLVKDPLVLYDTLSNARHLPPPPVVPRHYERGFLPNQMYLTASGGITFGHHKRSSKGEKVPRK